MHFYGKTELEVGPVYFCAQEEDNPMDPNDVAVYKDKLRKHCIGYFRREDAMRIKPLFKYIKGHCYLDLMFEMFVS